MRTTIANLKHLYQCRPFWVFYFLIFMWAVFDDRSNGTNPFFWVVNFNAGLGFGLLQQEILSRPFAFCLPGHRPIPRRMIFILGVVLNLLLSSSSIFRNTLVVDNMPLVVVASFSLGLACYLLFATFFCMASDRQTYVFAAIPFMAVMLGTKRIDYLVIHMPWLAILLAAIVCGVAWVCLQGDRLVRRHAGRSTHNFSGYAKARTGATGLEIFASSKAVPDRIHAFFHAQIGAHRVFSVARGIWADLYVSFAPLLARWQLLILCLPAAIILALVSGRARPVSSEMFAIKFPALLSVILFNVVACVSLPLAFQMPMPVFSKLLLTRGRQERFRAMLSVASAVTLVASFLLLFITVCTVLLRMIAPGTLGSVSSLFGFLATLMFVAAPFSLVPLGLTLRLITKYPDTAVVLAVGACLPIVIAAVRNWYEWSGVALSMVAVVCCWLAFTFAAYRICTKRALAQ